MSLHYNRTARYDNNPVGAVWNRSQLVSMFLPSRCSKLKNTQSSGIILSVCRFRWCCRSFVYIGGLVLGLVYISFFKGPFPNMSSKYPWPPFEFSVLMFPLLSPVLAVVVTKPARTVLMTSSGAVQNWKVYVSDPV